jgi:hypothetical protein
MVLSRALQAPNSKSPFAPLLKEACRRRRRRRPQKQRPRLACPVPFYAAFTRPLFFASEFICGAVAPIIRVCCSPPRMQRAGYDAYRSSSSDDWAAAMYDSEAGVMDAVSELYSLRQSNTELLATLSKAQACLHARLAEQFEESRASPPATAGGEKGQEEHATHTDSRAKRPGCAFQPLRDGACAHGVQPGRAACEDGRAVGASRLRTSVGFSTAPPLQQRRLHSSHPALSSVSFTAAHPTPALSSAFSSGLFVIEDNGPSPLPPGSSVFAFLPAQSPPPAAGRDGDAQHDRAETPSHAPHALKPQTLPHYLRPSSPHRSSADKGGSCRETRVDVERLSR